MKNFNSNFFPYSFNFLSKANLIIFVLFFILFYIAADLPKLYILVCIFFVANPNFWHLPSKKKLIYFLPCLFIFLFYLEPILYYEKYTYNELKNCLWFIVVVQLVFIINRYSNYLLENISKALFCFFFGLFISFLLIFILNLFLFDYPITRSGYIHPFSFTQEGYLFLNLNYLKNINPISISSLYTIISLWITVCFGLLTLNKLKNIMTAVIIVLLIIGLSFGSKFFVVYFFFINIFFFLSKKNFKFLFFILISFFVIFFSNISIYSFVEKNNYIRFFQKNNDIKIDENFVYESLEGIKLDYNKPIFLISQGDFFYFNIDNRPHMTRLKKNNKIFEKFKILKIKENQYKNNFTINPNTFQTSYDRFFQQIKENNFFNRSGIIKIGFENVHEKIAEHFTHSFENRIKKTNNVILDSFIQKGYSISLVFHNLFLDSIYGGSILAALVLLFMYVVIFNIYKDFFYTFHLLESRHFVIIALLNFFLYEQLFHTSILSGKFTYFLFSIIFVLLLNIKSYYNKTKL